MWTLTLVSPMSRRELLAATAALIGTVGSADIELDHRPLCARRLLVPRARLRPQRPPPVAGPDRDRLYLAGEAVGVNNPATVHGAVLSGQYAAAELMRQLG